MPVDVRHADIVIHNSGKRIKTTINGVSAKKEIRNQKKT
jgi:hypothetical protein